MYEKKKKLPALLVPGASSSYRPTKAPLGQQVFDNVVDFANDQIKSGIDDKNALLTKGLHCLMIKHTGTTKEKIKIMDIDLDELLEYLRNSGLIMANHAVDSSSSTFQYKDDHHVENKHVSVEENVEYEKQIKDNRIQRGIRKKDF